MELITLLLIASALAMDSFAVSISAGLSLKKLKLSTMLRISITFAVFQGMMPVIGWFVGQSFADIITAYDHWVVFLLLSIIGGKMIYESFCNEPSAKCININCNKTITGLAIATSIDALAVGVSFSLLNLEIYFPALVIGLITLVFSFAGLTIGYKLGSIFRSKIELIGGIILIAIGIKILISHLMA